MLYSCNIYIVHQQYFSKKKKRIHVIAFRAYLDNSVQFPHLRTLILIISSKIHFPYKLLQRLRSDTFKRNYFIILFFK